MATATWYRKQTARKPGGPGDPGDPGVTQKSTQPGRREQTPANTAVNRKPPTSRAQPQGSNTGSVGSSQAYLSLANAGATGGRRDAGQGGPTSGRRPPTTQNWLPEAYGGVAPTWAQARGGAESNPLGANARSGGPQVPWYTQAIDQLFQMAQPVLTQMLDARGGQPVSGPLSQTQVMQSLLNPNRRGGATPGHGRDIFSPVGNVGNSLAFLNLRRGNGRPGAPGGGFGQPFGGGGYYGGGYYQGGGYGGGRDWWGNGGGGGTYQDWINALARWNIE